ncbi:MAG TPA: 2-C-methyl-D-erythritol 2,4-cyclodiphosphate synthase [Acidobacteriota bacterium]|nr:2-C-methyl-D-erythritol 2,4-cyclodiphosphate synthase [Acidobacteriota bacterium]
MKIKIGIGYDIHKLVKGEKLYLGGIHIPFSKGLLGHSDGDSLIHALADALLGALGKGDIGTFFPDTDPKYKNISSRIILQDVMEKVRSQGYEISNIDSIIIAEKPKMEPHIPEMKKILCPILGIHSDGLGIKAKTKEGFGEIGRGTAIAAWAAVILKRS